MKKTIGIIMAVVLIALIFVTVMLLTDKDNPLEQPQTNVTETQPVPDIDYYEKHASEGITNTSTAPSMKVEMAEGKVVYADGTEKSWLELYKEQEALPDSQKLFTFIGGTTLVNAFENNENITAVVIPEGVWELESCFNNNFIDCTVTLPSSLESISHTFENARGIQLITKKDSKMVVIDNVLYTDYGETLLMYPDWKEDHEFVLPAAVKKIAKEAMTDNVYITHITFNQALEYIDKRGINSCPNIITIELPETMKKIDTAFNNMNLLESINIPTECFVEGLCFMKCPQLKLTVANSNYIYENDVLYNRDKTLLIRYMESKSDEEFTIPESVVTLSPAAFAYNKHLQTLNVNATIETINTAFSECTGLQTVNFPETVKTIKTMAFTRLPQLTTINYAGTMEQWLAVNKESDWIISSGEYVINCSDESVHYKGTM